MNKIRLSFTGCGLGDFIYKNVDFSSEKFRHYCSLTPGDGGLSPGKLVFADDFERFSGVSVYQFLQEVLPDSTPDTFNIGGPALVSSICAAQLFADADVNYFGATGTDEKSFLIKELLARIPFLQTHFEQKEGGTPYTIVLSDPEYDKGKGERMFINNIGAAAHFSNQHLTSDFWKSDLLVFGGTALVPQLHTDLTALLQEAKNRHCFTVVTTVFDFISEKQHPHKPWPLGDTAKSLPLIDLLIMDFEEAKRISGGQTEAEMVGFFKTQGCKAFVFTRGSEPTYVCANSSRFEPVDRFFPICPWVADDFRSNPALRGDTTGCGDNFAGAVIASIAHQLQSGKKVLSLEEAVALGTVAGAHACYFVGGVFFEEVPGQRATLLNEWTERFQG